jgi:hypothetical protein
LAIANFKKKFNTKVCILKVDYLRKIRISLNLSTPGMQEERYFQFITHPNGNVGI